MTRMRRDMILRRASNETAQSGKSWFKGLEYNHLLLRLGKAMTRGVGH
jgi:hypothetical protein